MGALMQLWRQFLFAASMLLALALPFSSFAGGTGGMEVVPLWHSHQWRGGPKGAATETARGFVKNVANPDIRAFLPEKPNGAGVLVMPGGGYKAISRRDEGYAAAKWLNERGYAAFVLTYRLPREGWDDGVIVSLQDAQRAIRVIRSMASRFGIKSERLGVLGFSAGGHLAGLTALRSGFRSYASVDEIDKLSAKPDWAALIYPVITLKPPYQRSSTFKQMLDPSPSAEQMMKWSVETYVDHQAPPFLLVHADDDPSVDVHHSRIMKKYCDAAKVPAELVELPAGGHGFGMSRPGAPSFGWSAKLETWLKQVDKPSSETARL
ncbi:alpha/beta hydrolase [Rhizobium sp. L1K21]|uniref:alpha/beta hydrolase n=1 Tax=Rhizobium sp. L1K21 TaxID=2954933 RepID=UPI002093294D|nr:alpha/beta hydrolase [Rhizobium sp. L1K21]MCO6186197.1 alpha/beta hydrolase [Rhizobium sp. L1K21]